MICTTVRTGMECRFMSANGCSYNGGICHEIVEQCDGCKRASKHSNSWYCSACPDPIVKWKNGDCNLASHVSTSNKDSNGKLKPLKASNRNYR